MLNKKTFKVLALVPKKDGGTYFMRIGNAYTNRDDSINLYLDVLPLHGKLQLRELDENDLREREQRRASGPSPGAGALTATLAPAPQLDAPF